MRKLLIAGVVLGLAGAARVGAEAVAGSDFELQSTSFQDIQKRSAEMKSTPVDSVAIANPMGNLPGLSSQASACVPAANGQSQATEGACNTQPNVEQKPQQQVAWSCGYVWNGSRWVVACG